MIARPDAEFGEEILGLHRHHARLPVQQRVARGFQHRAPRAAAADPACDNGAIRANDRLGARFRRRHRHRAHDGRQHERLLGGFHLRDQIHHLDMRVHRSAHHSFAK